MKLIDLTMKDYLNLLGSDAPAPGGGTVSAFAGAQGVALFMMVCDLTMGKEKYAPYEDICIEAKERGQKLLVDLAEAVDKDTDAFNMVSAAFKMPKATDEEKAARSHAIAAATIVATEVPFGVMKMAREGLEIARGLVGKTNSNAASDLGVAAINLLACIRGAWLNVKINLPGIKDTKIIAGYEVAGDSICQDAESMADDIYKNILRTL